MEIGKIMLSWRNEERRKTFPGVRKTKKYCSTDKWATFLTKGLWKRNTWNGNNVTYFNNLIKVNSFIINKKIFW